MIPTPIAPTGIQICILKHLRIEEKTRIASLYEPSSNTKLIQFIPHGWSSWVNANPISRDKHEHKSRPRELIPFPTRQHNFFFGKSNLSIITPNSINESDKWGPFRLCHNGLVAIPMNLGSSVGTPCVGNPQELVMVSIMVEGRHRCDRLYSRSLRWVDVVLVVVDA